MHPLSTVAEIEQTWGVHCVAGSVPTWGNVTSLPSLAVRVTPDAKVSPLTNFRAPMAGSGPCGPVSPGQCRNRHAMHSFSTTRGTCEKAPCARLRPDWAPCGFPSAEAEPRPHAGIQGPSWPRCSRSPLIGGAQRAPCAPVRPCIRGGFGARRGGFGRPPGVRVRLVSAELSVQLVVGLQVG